MIHLKVGRVKSVQRERDLIKAQVEVDESLTTALAFPQICGEIETGDEVVVNTTGVDLGLGTGGYSFILWNLHRLSNVEDGKGHVMKLRYTPLQIRCLSIEEEESPFHERLIDACSLEGMPCLLGSLHSQLAPLVITLKKINPELKIAYIMTDGGALPFQFSHLARLLKEEGFIDYVITCGNSFGGDYEAVNVASALVASQTALGVNICVVVKGPGIVGTGTILGHTGIEQGEIANTVRALSGVPVLVPRISFKDKRERHKGLSHHFLTVLSKIILFRAVVPLPSLSGEEMSYLWNQIEESGLKGKHDFRVFDVGEVLRWLDELPFEVTTMGRSFKEDKAPFLSAEASAKLALNFWRENEEEK
jgi:hypothetical protein